MDYNGMTEEEYLDSLLKQASDDTTNEEKNEETSESTDIAEETALFEDTEMSEDTEVEFNFDDIFGDIAEAESAPAESHEDEETVAEEADIFSIDSLFGETEPEEQPEASEESSESMFDFSSILENEPESASETADDDFQRSLDSIIGELENNNEVPESDEFDIFSQIDNTELSDEELSQDIDDMSLMEAVGILLDEDEQKKERQQNIDSLLEYEDEFSAASAFTNEAVLDESKPKKSFFKKIKEFLIEQGEDTEADIAAQEAAELAKEEKKQKAEEEKEQKAEAKAAKQEQREAKKAAKKEARENKALERQMKKEQKKAEQEASGEPKYKVTFVKIAFLFTVVAAFGILLWAISDFNYKRVAKKNAMIYFTADRYELAYEAIAGLEPKKSDEVLYEQIRTVMYVQKQYDSYLSYYNMGMKEEALNSLLKGIDKYDKYYENAEDLGILEDMNIVLEKIYLALEESYELSKEEAEAITNIEDAVEYSVALREVINSIKE